MKNANIKKSDYQNLCIDLSSLIETGRLRAVQAVSEILIETYWKIGRRLNQIDDPNFDMSEKAFLNQLGAELDLNPTVLYRSLRFYRSYPRGLPKSPDARRLGWGAHLDLLPVKDKKQRLMYMQQAIDENWTRATLRRAINRRLFDKTIGAETSSQQQLLRPDPRLHTYVGIVDRVIDGDTLLIRIDLGFKVWKTESIRLRGIDAPEMYSPAGKKAKSFVAAKLEGIEFVVLHTYKTDKYARYVADLFYSEVHKSKQSVLLKGNFLNQELIDSGQARFVHKFV
ncbi:MAG: thermonuclease family protein [Deltaproteobacteria bacterium]|nr:thermonuclease family protein [Deltaproteobacteria bacterium]